MSGPWNPVEDSHTWPGSLSEVVRRSVTVQLNSSDVDVGAAVGDEVDRVAFLDGDRRRIGCGLAADDVPGADDAGAGGDDAAADAVAVWLGVAEHAFDVQLAGCGRGPAADGGVAGVAGVAAGCVEQCPADCRIRAAAGPPCQVSLAKWGSGWNWTVRAGSSTVPQPNCQVS